MWCAGVSIKFLFLLYLILVPSPIIMGRRPNVNGNRRICFCLWCRGQKTPVHRNTVGNHSKQKGYMTPADIASLLEQQAAEGSGSEDEEDSFLDAQLREEESERLVAANQALFKDLDWE